MKILAIDTSAEACSIALLLDEEIKCLHEITPRQQAQMILPLIKQLLNEENIKFNQLDALAFGCGPGSFTGVRIATSVMQGLGFALNLPLIPISSLAALAQATYAAKGWQKLYVGIDARIQEIYWGMYQVNPNGLVELVGKENVGKPNELLLPDNSEWYGVGNAWAIYAEQIPFKPIYIDSTRIPHALGLLPLAKQKYDLKDFTRAENALPTYLRDEVAKKS